MLYLIDSADVAKIRAIAACYPIAGVTTNPTLISAQRLPLRELLLSIREAIGPQRALHAQTLARDAEGIVREAKMLDALVGPNFYIKIPVSAEALRASTMLRGSGVGVTMTAVFSPQQALLSAASGADYVAPYVNRLDDAGSDGGAILGAIAGTFRANAVSCGILAAGFKNVLQVQRAAALNCAAATLAPELYAKLISHPLTDAAVAGFERDWHAFYGDADIEALLK